jgi:hypothetical protein
VVEAGDHDLVAWAQVPTERAAQAEGEGRHVRSERDLVRIVRTHEVGAGGVDIGKERIGFDRRPERPAVVGVAALEVRRDGGDALARHLGATRPVEECDRHAVDGAAERRKMIAHRGLVQAPALPYGRHLIHRTPRRRYHRPS